MRTFAAVVCLVFLAVPISWGASDDGHPMRWRVFYDVTSGSSFRFPYDYRIPDQYAGNLVAPGGGGGGAQRLTVDPAIAQDPKALEAFIRAARQVDPNEIAVRHRWLAKADLPADIAGDDLAAVLAHLAGEAYARTEPFDYYGNVEQRPHGSARWAPAGITALRAFKPGACAQIIAHAGGYVALLVRGNIDDGDNRALLDTLEILPDARGGRRPTWREAQTSRHKKVLSGSGAWVSIGRSESVPWAMAWECETQHYHITCNASPQTTVYVAGLMEALFAAYSDVFQPKNLPPYKMEIHILPDVSTFVRMARAKGFGAVQDGSTGSLTGGFFVPSQMSIYTFEKPVPRFPTRMDKVLAHEATHQFVHLACNGTAHVPTWINEGLAVHFESGEFKGGRFTWKPPVERIQLLSQLYDRNRRTLVPLEQYFDHRGHRRDRWSHRASGGAAGLMGAAQA